MSVTGVATSLPQPEVHGSMSVESAMAARRSVRSYGEESLSLREVSQLLWAAQGVTRPGGYRTCPSAGALYPLQIRLVAGKVQGLGPGIYRYGPENHAVTLCSRGDVRKSLAAAALGQSMVARAPATVAISAIFERTTFKYGERGRRYVFMEAGNASENVHLQAAALGLGTVIIGAFHDDRVAEVLELGREETPILLMPVGR